MFAISVRRLFFVGRQMTVQRHAPPHVVGNRYLHRHVNCGLSEKKTGASVDSKFVVRPLESSSVAALDFIAAGKVGAWSNSARARAETGAWATV